MVLSLKWTHHATMSVLDIEGMKILLRETLQDCKSKSIDSIFIEIDQELGKPILKHDVFVSAHFDLSKWTSDSVSVGVILATKIIWTCFVTFAEV